MIWTSVVVTVVVRSGQILHVQYFERRIKMISWWIGCAVWESKVKDNSKAIGLDNWKDRSAIYHDKNASEKDN